MNEQTCPSGGVNGTGKYGTSNVVRPVAAL